VVDQCGYFLWIDALEDCLIAITRFLASGTAPRLYFALDATSELGSFRDGTGTRRDPKPSTFSCLLHFWPEDKAMKLSSQ
jgi:hypothetical protein